ncbi:MAG: hypothetical protein ACF8MJ_05955 [Phycisphaerales bacterium JB050]
MNKTSMAVVSSLLFLHASMPVFSQHPSVSDTYLPLVEHGDPIPEFNVGELHLQVDGWDIIPIYSLIENPGADPDESSWDVRVRGFFVATDPVATIGDNLIAVWYERPDDPAQELWTAHTWPQGGISVAVAAYSVKLNLGIPDIQDQLWAIDDLNFVTAKESVPFSSGFVAGDPLAEPINASPNRDEEIQILKDAGYPLADVPFETGDQGEVQENLEYLAETFELVIASHSWSAGGGRIVWPHHRDPMWIPDDPPANAPPAATPGPASCSPGVEAKGPWEPIDPTLLCGCVNGPTATTLHTTVEVGASGQIESWVPWPPPLGTEVTLQFSANATVSFHICYRTRYCFGPARRTVKYLNEDCTISTFSETAENYRFEKTYWVVGSGDPPSCIAAGPNWYPPLMPFDSQDCGLTLEDGVGAP